MDLSTPWRNNTQVLAYNVFQASLIDTNTGTCTAVPGFEHREFNTGAVRFSPDGKWLLWATGTSVHPQWALTDFQSFRTVLRPRINPGLNGDHPSFAWCRDSLHWAEADTSNSYAIVQCVNGSQAQKIKIPSSDVSDPLASVTGNTLSMPPTLPQSSPQMQASEHPFSPMGDRIAWFTATPDDTINWSFYVENLRRLHRIPSYPALRYKFALWISNSDGSHAYQVLPVFSGETAPVCLNWTHDGKRLSFYYHDALWVAPVK